MKDKVTAQDKLHGYPRSGTRYLHYKGGSYTVVCCSILESDADTVLVTYRSEMLVNFEGQFYTWTRTADDFFSTVDFVQGKIVPRFTLYYGLPQEGVHD